MNQSLKDKILGRLEEFEKSPKRSLGQNFLVSELVVEKIVRASEPENYDLCLEVGPGLGSLTDLLKTKAKKLQLVELDQELAEFWKAQGLTVHQGDALEFPWQDHLTENSVLVSNLPYQISSRLVVDLSTSVKRPKKMVLMFQKEVAQRMRTEESSADYGLITVIAQTFWHVRLVLEAGSVDFHPKPRVASRVLSFDYKESPVKDPMAFLSFLKVAFQNRRKKLAPKLKGYAGVR